MTTAEPLFTCTTACICLIFIHYQHSCHSVFQMTLLIEIPAEYDAKLCYESKDKDMLTALIIEILLLTKELEC